MIEIYLDFALYSFVGFLNFQFDVAARGISTIISLFIFVSYLY